MGSHDVLMQNSGVQVHQMQWPPQIRKSPQIWLMLQGQRQNQSSEARNKKEELCPHSFKCLNCHGDHQADSNLCLFWRHRFNREWQQKKYAEICENRSKSIHSEVNDEVQQ